MAFKPQVEPYGTWESPISADLVSGKSVSFAEVHTFSMSNCPLSSQMKPKAGSVYLIEGRPAENGRCCIVERQGDEWIDILPPQYNARTRVHEYGGGACLACPDGSLIFSDFKTNGVFRLNAADDVQPIVDASETLRFADFDVHPRHDNLILAVQEDHSGGTIETVENRIVLINSDDKSTRVIRQGADFYWAPKFNHDGSRICWIQWNHPDMPFTGCELYVADWKNGSISNAKYVAGKAGEESVGQPKWHEDGTLFFSSDRTGFAQLYRLAFPSFEVRPMILAGWEDADITAKGPFVVLGSNTYIILNSKQLVVTATKLATDSLLLVDIETSNSVELPLGLVNIPMNSIRRISDTKFVILGSEYISPSALYSVDVTKPSEKLLLKSSTTIPLSPSIYSIAKHVTFPRSQGKETGGVAHAIVTPPHNPSYVPVPGSKPPVIVSIHGGPTSHTTPGLDLTTQYWTSRGYAYVHVNYVGSSGYGREYRQALNYFWGIKDVEDSASCVAYLAEAGLVDGKKAGIVGGSAGGYTVLQSLVNFPKLWAGGNSLYGIGNLKTLSTDTHKYESHYLYRLIFPDDTTEEEKEKVYRDRSPCLHADKIESPLLLLQGADDRVVPLPQSEEMERVMKKGGKDVKLVVFEGEGHGFRAEKNLKASLLEEEKLWRRTLLGLKE
ncbi:Dipeptidyl aminopeptidase BIII [Hyphodiscus hymeniophilus]|uniref:Dipeptidyl aminopeptidase BIII n=1 Tax=Hyphodiscus hymeniophilus TaxID=353542 RepID=A0A9P7AY58_9HELO|nr:Dipeptidyl aminopeptidase BIII [Hyphodiscus hymeniophilus]